MDTPNSLDTFNTRVAIAVSLSILLWKDSTPYTHFPNVSELVRIELGRVLNHHLVKRECPWLASRIPGSVRAHLEAEPWDVDPPKLLVDFAAVLHTDQEYDVVGNAIMECAHYDPTFEIIRRHGKPPTAKADDMIRTARGVVNTLKLPARLYAAVEDGVRAAYSALYSQLRRSPGN